MTEQNEQQITEALRAGEPIILAPGPRSSSHAVQVPHDVWDLPDGTAWVYLREGHSGRLTRPVILSDGFNTGPSNVDLLWEGLEHGEYPFLSELRRRGRDVIILGFTERSASILDNAEAAKAAIQRAITEREGDAPLAVGGFSMGGLVTRYALAEMERNGIDHQTALYWSYDSPHRGAWIPIALQAFGHYIRDLDPRFSDQINSPAARQLLSRHIQEWNDEAGVSKEREEFLDALDSVGGWPQRPRKIGVANGVGSGTGNGLDPGQPTVEGSGWAVTGTSLYAQSEGDDQLVAWLRVLTQQKPDIRTSGLPAIDGAPGGTLQGFGILGDALNSLLPILGFATDVHVRSHCFVPAVSAVAIRDVDTTADLYSEIDGLPAQESELDEFKLASANEEHTLMTRELGSWILDRLP